MDTVQTDTAAHAATDDAARYQARVLQLLDAHVAQRGGIDPRNYGSWADYRAESRSVTRDRHHYNALRSAVHWRTFSREQWADAFRAFSGRLTLQHGADGMPARLEYVTGQYFPTEYRRAACAVLASLLWADKRESMPAPVRWRVTPWASGIQPGPWEGLHAACARLEREGGRMHGGIEEQYKVGAGYGSAGDYIRAQFRRQFGRTIAGRWFS